MNINQCVQKESRSVCNLVVILHGEIFEFSYRSFFPSWDIHKCRQNFQGVGAQGLKIDACLKSGDLGVLGGGIEKLGDNFDVIYGWTLNSLLIF